MQIRLQGWPVFTAVKYLTYALLLVNVYLFLQEELASLAHTFGGPVSLAEYVQVFAATIDTAAWVVLLLLFELETSVLEDRQIRGAVRLGLHGVRGLCSIAIVYAFSGYCAELATLYDSAAMAAHFDACAELAGQWSLLLRLDEYEPLSAANCEPLRPDAIRLQAFSILATPEALAQARWLAWTDVINAGAWILVVIVLEIEVRLQLRGRLTDRIMRSAVHLKYVLYAALFLAAAYWGFAGTFLDFWDACLWLFAFIFIELNVFDWQRESRAEGEGEGAGA